MKALEVVRPGEAVIRHVPKPIPGPGDVVIRVEYCGICGTDSVIYSGETMFVREGLIKYPVRIGHEYSGVVDSVGGAVTAFRAGDRVVSDDAVSCGLCGPCQAGDYARCGQLKSLGTVNCWDGAFAEYVLMPERHVFHLPDNVSLEDAALIEPCTVALSGIGRCGISDASRVLVVGTGPIGLSCIQLVKALGAARVYVSGRKKFKLDTALALGADGVIDATREPLAGAVAAMSGGRMADVILETSGNAAVLNDCLDAAAENADLALIGFYEEPLNGFNIDKLVIRRINMKGITTDFGTVQRVIDLMGSGKLRLSSLITHRFTLDEMPALLARIHSFDAEKIKIMIRVSP